MSKWLKHFSQEEYQAVGDKGASSDIIFSNATKLSPLSPCHHSITTEENNVFQHSMLQKPFDEQCIKQFYETKYANFGENGLSESEAQHQALNDLLLRFIDITQVSYGSLEVRNFIQRLYKICKIPLMKD